MPYIEPVQTGALTMCYVEFNWTADCYQFRIGQTFTDWRGTRSLPTRKEWEELLARDGYKLVKTASRTWEVVKA